MAARRSLLTLLSRISTSACIAACTAVCVALLLAATPTQADAQYYDCYSWDPCDFDAPQISFTPSGGTFTSSSLSLNIAFNDYAGDPSCCF